MGRTVHRYLTELLDPIERARLAGFRSSSDAALYLATHALARIVIGARLDLPPASLQFDRTCRHCGRPHGKPAVVGHAVRFSIAHSGLLAVVAVTDTHPVGVDVEELQQRIHVTALSQAALSEAELRHLSDLPAQHRHRALLTYWTRKEAVLKATGDGLSTRPSQLSVTPPHAHPSLLRRPPAWRTAGPIHLADLHPPGPYVGALATLTARPTDIADHDGTPLLRCAGEMEDHLGCTKGDPAGRNGENSRNGKRAKTVITEAGPVDIEVPRDRDSTWRTGRSTSPPA